MIYQRTTIPAPLDCSNDYRSGWFRGDALAIAGGSLNADGPSLANDEAWTGFIDALAAHRNAEANVKTGGGS